MKSLKKTLGYGKNLKDKHIQIKNNYKILKQSYFKSVRGYDIIHSWIK